MPTIADLQVKLEWKPIETAPKETWIVIKGKHWRGRKLRACAARYDGSTWWMADQAGCCYPTHWLCVLEDN